MVSRLQSLVGRIPNTLRCVGYNPSRPDGKSNDTATC